MNFESELKKGIFMISECTQCNKTIWPPSEFCNQCFKEVSWKKSPSEGKIIEFSRQNNDYFCLIEIKNGVRIIGKVSSGTPNVGQNIKLDRCGIRDGSYFFEMSLI
ncbi:conserved hypothetical protein [metagenome]